MGVVSRSQREDRLVAELMAALGDVPIIGGSTGDGRTSGWSARSTAGRPLRCTRRR
jgi:hypothetical protein